MVSPNRKPLCLFLADISAVFLLPHVYHDESSYGVFYTLHDDSTKTSFMRTVVITSTC